MVATCHELYGFALTEWESLALEMRVRFAVGRYIGGTYSRDVRFAYSSPGVPDRLVADPCEVPRIDCSSMTTSVLTACFPSSAWGSQGYGDLQVYKDRLPDRPDSPIDAVENAHVGVRIENNFEPGMWHLVQGWRRFNPEHPDETKRYSGHAFLVKVADDGVSMVMADSQPGTGPQWTTTTWGKLRRRYPVALYAAAIGEGMRG